MVEQLSNTQIPRMELHPQAANWYGICLSTGVAPLIIQERDPVRCDLPQKDCRSNEFVNEISSSLSGFFPMKVHTMNVKTRPSGHQTYPLVI